MRYLCTGGLNDLEVIVLDWKNLGKDKKAIWLGHDRFRCGVCLKGYFSVKDEKDRATQCPACLLPISVRRISDDP